MREARLRLDLTQRELAARLGLDQSQIARWETGRKEPGVRVAVRVAEALGTTVDQLWPPSDEATGHAGAATPSEAGR